MPSRTVEVSTQDGICDAYLACPNRPGTFPAVLMYMDGIGVRDTLRAMADRLASHGYVVLLPNMYYRLGRTGPVDAREVLKPENRPQMMERVQSITPQRLFSDADALIDCIDRQPEVRAGSPIGVVGYCMGARLTLQTAAHLAGRVAAAATFHGSRLATDAADSPHLLAGRISAELYLGHADQDAGMPADQIERLCAALQAGGVRFESQVYYGARHGWTMDDLAVYDPVACETHWARLLALYARALPQGLPAHAVG